MKKNSLSPIIKELLKNGTVNYFLAYGKGSFWFKVRPLIIREPVELKNLEWNRFCYPNLTTYLKDSSRSQDKIGVVVKGCDVKSVVELIKGNQIDRENLFLLQVPCDGTVDPGKVENLVWISKLKVTGFEETGNGLEFITKEGRVSVNKEEVFFSKCYKCDFAPSPLVDRYLDEERLEKNQPSIDNPDLYEELRIIEEMNPEKRSIYWEKQFSRCIRCFACRNVCPVCYCPTCVFDQKDTSWISKGVKPEENNIFHLTRALHVATLCTGCGECERVCPMKLPLMELNLKLIKEVDELYHYKAGVDLQSISPLKEYGKDDYDEFK